MNDFDVFVLADGGMYVLYQTRANTEEQALADVAKKLALDAEKNGEEWKGLIGKAFLHKRDRTVVRRTEFAVVN